MSDLVLPSDLGIEAAADLHAQLRPQLATASEVVLDGGAVERIHSAGLQLLLAFVRARHAAGLATRFSAASDILRDAVRLLGLAADLAMPAAATESRLAASPIQGD